MSEIPLDRNGEPIDISIDKLIEEMDRELKMRGRVYPRLVSQNRATPREVDERIVRAQQIRRLLVVIRELGLDGTGEFDLPQPKQGRMQV